MPNEPTPSPVRAATAAAPSFTKRGSSDDAVCDHCGTAIRFTGNPTFGSDIDAHVCTTPNGSEPSGDVS